MSRVIVATGLGTAERVEAVAAAVAVACSRQARAETKSVLLLDLREEPIKARPGLLATPVARRLESRCREIGDLTVHARGHLCVGSGPRSGEIAITSPPGALPEVAVVVLVVEPAELRSAMAWSAGIGDPPAALVRADLGRDRALVGLLVGELHEAGSPVKVWTRRPGAVASRRALAGLDPGGWVGGRAGRTSRRLLGSERGQAVPMLLAAAVLVVALALILVAVGSGATAKARLQRAADLGALSAAGSMREDFDRLFAPARRLDGSVNPAHLSRDEYLARASEQAVRVVALNDAPTEATTVRFPDGESFAPVRVSVEIDAAIGEEHQSADEAATTLVDAEAEVSITSPAAGSGGCAAVASGGGYGGPLACRQGKPMRPDVGAAFDRMSMAAAAAGVTLLVNSGFRSDAEQAVLFAANPDPRMVAPPGHSLHRCGTELDLGPPEAYAWLAGNAPRFGFLQRYSWEAWHYGYIAGPEPCTAAGESGGLLEAAAHGDDREGGDGRANGLQGLPGFVPAPFRTPLEQAAARHGVSAALLAAQLMAESNFNPNAVSPAGAQGIAQFMPGTAAAYGLDDPFDPAAAIDAQARLMADLLGQFDGTVQLALAAYNAGPAPVLACSCVPGYPETQAYVARIMAMLEGAGALYAPAPVLEIRLVG